MNNTLPANVSRPNVVLWDFFAVYRSHTTTTGPSISRRPHFRWLDGCTEHLDYPHRLATDSVAGEFIEDEQKFSI